MLMRRLWNSPTANTWAAFTVRTLNVVLVLPLVLRTFTDAETALWSVFSTLMVFQTVADFGFQATFTRLTAYAFAGARSLTFSREADGEAPEGEPNWELIRRIVGATRWLYRTLSWALGGLCLVLGTALLWRRVAELGLAPERLVQQAAVARLAGDTGLAERLLSRVSGVTTQSEAWIAWGIIVVTTMCSFRGNGAICYLAGGGHVALVRRWEALFGLGALVTSPLVFWWNGNLLALILTNQVWVLLGAARNQWLARNLHEGRLREYPRPHRDREILRAGWPQAWRAGLGNWATVGSVQLGGLLYAQQKDSSAVASYLISLRLAQAISVVSGGAVYSRLPRLAGLWSRREDAAFAKEAGRGVGLCLWASAIPLAGLAWLGPWFLRSGLQSPVPFVAERTWMLLALAVFCDRYGSAHLALEGAGNRVRWHISASVCALIFVTVGLAGFPFLGVDALPLGMLLGAGGFLTWFGRIGSRKCPGISWPAFDWGTAAAPAAVLLGALALRGGCTAHHFLPR